MASGQYRPGGDSGAASGGAGGFGGGDPNSPSGGGGSLEEAIPGVPGEDYPIFAEVPETSFFCDGQVDGGYYGDPEAECQVFHICAADGTGGLNKFSFLCPNGTLFNQQYFICDWWFNVDCSLTVDLYYLNDEIAAEREANSPGGGGDGYAGGGGGGGAGGARGGGGGQRGGGGGGSRGGSSSRGSPTGSGVGPRGSSSGSGGQPGTYKGASAGSGAGGSGRGNAAGGRGGSPGGRGGGGGGRRKGAGGRGSPSSSSGGQPGYGSANGDDTFGDYDGSAIGSPAIPGYGAPGGDGGFPPLNSYNRKSRQLGEIDIQQVIEDLEIETGAETLEEEEEEYGEY